MQQDKVIDMTRGPVLRQMTVFALPVLLGMVCQRIYNFADTYIVGRYLGDEALAAVSISGTAMYMQVSIMLGVTAGAGIVISQYYGGGKSGQIRRIFAASAFVGICVTILLTAGGIWTTHPLLRLLQTSDALLPMAESYLKVIYAGCGATMLYNLSASVLRAVGNSLVPLLFLIISSILNIVLDILFVAVLPLGTAGAALATVLAQLVSGAACLGYAFRILPFLRMSRADLKPDLHLVGQVIHYGVPTALQMSIISISDMTLQGVVNTYSTAMIVAYGVCIRFEGLGFQLADSIGSALATFTGQNAGSQNFSRIRKGVRSAYLMNLICYGIFGPAVFLLAPLLMQAFTDTPAAIRYGVEYMRIFSVFFLGGGILTVYHNVLRAAGDVTVTILLGVSEVITRTVCAFLLPHLFGYRGLWFVSPLTWACAAAVGAVRYYSNAWESHAKKALEVTE